MTESDPIREAFSNILSEELQNSDIPNIFDQEFQARDDRTLMVIRNRTNEYFLPHEILTKISSRAIMEIPGLHRVVYDIATPESNQELY